MKMKFAILVLLMPLLLVSCKKAVDVELQESKPERKTTSYSDALRQLGRLTREFNTPPLRVQTTGVRDDTGSSAATGAEIPFDITEMVKSAVNSIGGNVTFVLYDPFYLKNQASLNFTTLDNKTKPDVVVQGGITEFDRALEVAGQGFDVGGEFDVGAETLGFDASSQDKESTSRIALDLNLIDFETLSAVPRMQAVNTIMVYKAAREQELGFSIFGAAFGVQGSVQKIQGRHAAVRVLVDLSILEILGKYLNIPYWKCVGEGARPDPVVLENIKDQYFMASPEEKVKLIQRLLYVYGFRNITQTGVFDAATRDALVQVKAAYGIPGDNLDEHFYEQLFLNVPVCGEPSKVQVAAVYDTGGGLNINQPVSVAPPPAPQAAAAKPVQKAAKQAAAKPKAPAPAPAAQATIQTAPAPAVASAPAPAIAPAPALVVPVSAPAPAPAAANEPLQVKVWTDKQSYREGEEINIFLQGNKDFYGKVVNITSDGTIIQLLPNPYRNLDFFKGGRTYRIPDTGDVFNLEVSPPYGEERLLVYASETQLGKVQLASAGQGLSVFQGSKAELDQGVRTRAISLSLPQDNSLLGPAPAHAADTPVLESTWVFRTGP